MEPVLTDFFLYSFSNFHVVPLHTLLVAMVAVVITKIHNVTHWCTLFNCLSRKQVSQNVHRWDQNVWVSKCLYPCCLWVLKCLFKTKSNKRGKAAILTTTWSAERTLHAIGKNYAIKTIPARKILERNLLAEVESSRTSLACPPIEISPMTKMWQKVYCFFSFSFF